MTTRREFLIGSGTLALGAASVLAGAGRAARGSTPGRMTMIIDQARCTGCRSCLIACKGYTATDTGHFNTRLLEEEDRHGRTHFTPVLCNQCDDPPCVRSCAAGATFKLENGIVVTDWARCTACGNCITACPYGARSADSRYGGRVDKCDFCRDRLQDGLAPVCVEACSAGARLFGDRENPEGGFATCLRQSTFRVLRPELETGPNVLYVQGRRYQQPMSGEERP
ncbi:MAG TPA: 4Fe-4S dicluster domain-containing protein [Desulfobulbus sp.]|nr:4Fe-4S dicluster domain-containing protein [Desulfobulbus sp.]